MPAYQNPRAQALHAEAQKLFDQAMSARTEAEKVKLRELGNIKAQEADKAENGGR